MAYVKYSGLTTPNEVLASISDYITSKGYQIIQPVADDLNIYQMDYSDGKRFAFQNRTGDYYIIMRTANGTQIFGKNDDPEMDVTTPDTNVNYTGIGMTVAEGYSSSQRWYNQYNAPKQFRDEEIYGVFMPMKVGEGYEYDLYCNNVTTPTDSIVFTLECTSNDNHICTHLVYADVYKYDSWEGGALFSGSSVKSLMGNDVNVFADTAPYSSTRYTLPVLSSGTISNTFLRMDIDNAPTPVRGEVLWACSGTDNITGKPMSLPIRTGAGMNGVIPHYWELQSHGSLDWGRNVNTLNGITLDMPLYVCVRRDPDARQEYACAGVISGIWYVCLLNTQSSGVYERSYPRSNDLCQVFSMSRRRGIYGFDGISIKQSDD